MKISWVALDRVAERQCLSDAEYRKQTIARPFRFRARGLTDEELLGKLQTFGISLDRASLASLCDHALSAEEIAKPFMHARSLKTMREKIEDDWIWICLEALWQRWFPDKPSFEMLDDKIQVGYERIESEETVAACRIWLDAWAHVLRIFDKAKIQSIDEFEDRFAGSRFLCNWIQDLEDGLRIAGLEDLAFFNARIRVCEEGIRRFGAESDLSRSLRRAIAESYFELGETSKADTLFRESLKIDPRSGWDWIAWSDCYRFGSPELRDLKRSDQLLLEGLSIINVRDSKYLVERLADSYEEQGREEEAKDLWMQARRKQSEVRSTWDIDPSGKILRQKTTMSFGTEGLPLDKMPKAADLLPLPPPSQATVSSPKVGRNEPCPCGSGKKFKKCCGK